MVQMEIFSNDKWHPVVRYDTAHGAAHKDLMHYDGRIDKMPIFGLDYTDSLLFAETDLLANWENYREMFLKEIKHKE